MWHAFIAVFVLGPLLRYGWSKVPDRHKNGGATAWAIGIVPIAVIAAIVWQMV